MRKILPFLMLSLLACLSVRAQVFILNDNMFRERLSEIKTMVLDSLTNEPVAFASVYVIPAKDTTITNFTLTDAKGEAKLDEVPFGNYVFHVEMMGYKPFVKDKYFREREEDMGTIRLQPDEYFLQAATVSDIGNPIIIKKDTIEFNASSFRVGANAMLKDLLQRMPGMEITEDGKVKFNGEAIDKLTVGGRTFFFDDQSAALNNLPAAVVDKIRVIDRESEAARATGVQDGTREKVLDVALKKEYEKGWFGNVGVRGGTTLDPDSADDTMRDDRGFLYSGNILASAYTEKDQLTVIGNVQNINDSNITVVVVSSDGTRTSSLDQGLSTAAQLGVNANTTRIKDAETTVGANYKYTDTDSGTRSARTTYQDGGDLFSTTEQTEKQFARSLAANLEMKKETGKTWFHFRPSFNYSNTESFRANSSETSRGGAFVNRSSGSTRELNTTKTASASWDVTFRELGGNKKRSLQLSMSGSYGTGTGESAETTVLERMTGSETRALHYDSGNESFGAVTTLRYVEPLGEKWTLTASASVDFARSERLRDAFDADGHNDFYSSESRNRRLRQSDGLSLQYQFGPQSSLTLGATLNGTLNETGSKSYGISQTTGVGEWNWMVVPSLRFQHSKDNDRFTVSVSGSQQVPSASRMLPVLDISNPSRLSLGNIYLKPSGYVSGTGQWTRSNRERFSTLMVYLTGRVNIQPVESAQWYDTDGILYSVPVNTRKPTLSSVLIVDYTTPLDTKKEWSLSLSSDVYFSRSASYLTRGTLAGLDRDRFDYAAFMAEFWGGSEDGERFYDGRSGFSENVTRSVSPSGSVTVKYNREHYYFSLSGSTSFQMARYSLDPSADLNTRSTSFTARGSYTTRHEFEFNSDFGYIFYKGYSAGYGLPEWRWNAEISKNIGAFNLSVTVHDILNQTRQLTHTVTANYEEDVTRLVMGRYVLFGVKWNFGKMNAAHSQRAQRAALDMVF